MVGNISDKLDDMESRASCKDSVKSKTLHESGTMSRDENPLDAVEIVGISASRDLPPLKQAIIHNVIRQGGKLILTGDSKAGKTFLLIELATALAFGREWCGLRCEESTVLYVNLELEEAEFLHRFRGVLDKLGITKEIPSERIGILNARGKAANAKELTDALLGRLEANSYDTVIIDPIYKVQDGDENSAQSIALLVRELDRLAEEAGCTIIYSHHHPKRVSMGIASINRSAGSGVFGRDADASIDLVELNADDGSGGLDKAFRMEFDLRSFRWHPPVNIWFKDGLHLVDETGTLDDCGYAVGRGSGERKAAEKSAKQAQIQNALDALMGHNNEIPAKDFRKAINDKGGDHYIPGCRDNRTIRTFVEASENFVWENPSSSLAVIRRSETDDVE